MIPIGPIGSIALGLVGNLAYDKYKDWKAKQPPKPAIQPVPALTAAARVRVQGQGSASFTPVQAAQFTQKSPDGRGLMFDPPKARILRQALAFRSVVAHAVHASPGAPALPCWRVVPQQAELLSARALLDSADKSGATVLGSLELVHAANPLSVNGAMVIVIGGPALLSLTEPGRGFALLAQEKEEKKEEPAPAPPSPSDDPTEPVVPASAKNGTYPTKDAIGRVPPVVTKTPSV